MLDEYLEARAAVDAFDLKSEAWDIGWPAAEKKLKALQQRRDDLKPGPPPTEFTTETNLKPTLSEYDHFISERKAGE